MIDADLIVRGASEVLTMVPCPHAGRGATPDERLGRIVCGAVAANGERIVWVGAEQDLPGAVRLRDGGVELDARGGCVLPGLVDPHTHLVYAGSRVDEFARKMSGDSYLAIAAGGGGIMATVRATRDATDDELLGLAVSRAVAMRRHGVTSIEVKSGYGLALDAELRLLRVGRALERAGVVRTTTTFLGAHAVPAERSDERAEYVREICESMMPAVVHEGLADACDVYLDEGAFTLDETRVILTAARSSGLALRLHAGQFRDLGGPALAAELGALSADHLEAVSTDGLAAMARGGVSAVLLPGAWRTLRQTAPEAARLRAVGVSIAVGTDHNPGTSPTTDLWLCAALAVRDAGLTIEEALLAVTRESARAAGLRDAGLVAPGALADLAIFAEPDARALPYQLGDVFARTVVLRGRPVIS